MRLETITYDAAKGAWSVPGFPQALDSDRTLVVAFGAPELIDQPQPMRDLKNAFPRAKLVGCSSAGEIAGTTVRDRSLSVAVARFEHTDLQVASLEVSSSAQSFTAGQSLARQLQKPSLRAVFVLSEGLDVNGSELVRGLNSVLDPSVVVTGGLSGDGTAFKRTWVAYGDKIQSHLLVAVGLYGEHVVVGHGSKGGWDKFGPERVVTRSSANVLFELDNKPALALYKEYLGEKASGLPATGLLFPLALRSGPKDDKVLVRTLLAVDEAKQSMTFAGDLPQGSLVQLMKADYDRLIGGASGAAQSANQTAKGLPASGAGATLALAISCVGRRLVLGERTEEEVEAVLDVLPKGSQIVGFYSYGEISPYASGQCDLHNQTMTLTTISESPTPLPRAAAPERSAVAALPGARPMPRPAPALVPVPAPAPAPAPVSAASIPVPPAAARAGNGAAHAGNGKARPPMGALDLDASIDEPNTPRGAPAGGTVKVPMRGFRVESFSFDATRGKWSVPGMPQSLDSERTLIVAFGSSDLIDQPKPFQELRRAFPRSKLVGCSSAGEIAGTSVRDRSLSVAVARFEHTDLATAALQVTSAADSFNAGQSLARQLQKPSLRSVFVLSEGLNVNGSELVRGLNSALDPSVVVTGGLSGDGTAFKRTWVALGDKLTSGLIVAVGFYGDHLVVGHGSKGGWDKFGPERVVTKSSANVLFELDNKPALALYKEYLGEKASGLPATGLLFPLALRSGPKDDKVLVRTLLAVDEAKQSMTFAGDLPQGSLVQLMKADYDRLIAGASGAAQSAQQLATSGQGGTLAVAVSCVGRRLVLGERTEEEVEAVLDVLPKDSQIVGFYSYGEISPYASGQCDLHNQTMTLTTFSESPTAVARQVPVPAGNGKARPPMGALDLDVSIDEPNTPRGAPAGGTVKVPMRGFRVESFSYDAARGKWSVPGMPQSLDSERTLIVAFGSSDLIDQPKPFQELRRAFPRSKLVGCSSAGEIAGTSVRDRSLSVAVARFEHTDLATAALQVASAADSFNAGQSLARQLQKPSLRSVFVLSEGLNVNGSELVRGLNSALDPSVIVTGGLSGDGTAFKRTWVALGDKITSGLIVAVGFYGDHLVVGHGSKGGWDKFGPERTVTKSSANVLFELDNKPALALYKEYLGEKAAGLPATGLLFPLALRSGPKDDKVLVRTLLAVDEAKQSMTFAGDLPQGSLVQLMKADYDRLIAGASGAAQSAKQLAVSGQGGTLAVAVSCVGRRLVLGERTEEEVEAVLDVLPKDSQIVGFYSYGEISPYATGSCDLHNQTMTLTTFSESPVAIARQAPVGAGAVAPAAPAPASAAVPVAARARPSLATMTPMAPEPSHAPAPAPLPVPASAPAAPAARAPVAMRPEPTHPGHGAAEPTTPGGQAAAEPDTLDGVRPVRLTVTADPQAGLSISRKTVGSVQVVSFSGRLSESFQGARVGAEMAGTVVLDLSGVTRITSFGVREWLQMLAEAENRVESLYLARCSESVSSQLTMIRRFAGKGHVVSFYAPYLCSGCGTAFAALLDCVKDGEAIRSERPPDASCPRCGKVGSFDDDPRTYLSFGGQATHVPDDVRRALATLEPDAAFESLEKRIDGDTTRVRVASALDGSLRWTRVLEGVEGEVAIDLSGVPSSTGEGVQHLLEGMGKVDTEVRALKLEGVPVALLSSLAEATLNRPKLEVASARVEGYCISCNATRPALVRLEGNLGPMAKGQMPEVPCKRCQGPLTYDTAASALKAAARVLLKKDRPVVRAMAARSRSTVPVRAIALGGIGVVAVVALAWAAAMMTSRGRALDPAPAVTAPPGMAAAPGATAAAAAVPAAAPVNPAAWRTEVGLLPGWADNPVAVQGGFVYVVGRGAGSTEEEALAAARAAATDRLVSQLLVSLQGRPIADVVRASGADESSENAAAVAQRFQKQLGAGAALERTDTAVRGAGGQQEMVARYKIGQDAFKAATDRYGKTVAFRGITVAPFFPALERTVRTDGELVVVASRLPDVKVGDVLLSVGGKQVSALEALGKIALETAARPAPGGLQLQVERGGEAKTVTLGKPAKVPGGAPGKSGG